MGEIFKHRSWRQGVISVFRSVTFVGYWNSKLYRRTTTEIGDQQWRRFAELAPNSGRIRAVAHVVLWAVALVATVAGLFFPSEAVGVLHDLDAGFLLDMTIGLLPVTSDTVEFWSIRQPDRGIVFAIPVPIIILCAIVSTLSSIYPALVHRDALSRNIVVAAMINPHLSRTAFGRIGRSLIIVGANVFFIIVVVIWLFFGGLGDISWLRHPLPVDVRSSYFGPLVAAIAGFWLHRYCLLLPANIVFVLDPSVADWSIAVSKIRPGSSEAAVAAQRAASRGPG